ncbi:MAG TPA: hypothetical protein VH231_21405 [Solirubrobacteraceae bacterium]|jgi:hypothetical protein|nr:hypothetical protein [Solirubrobacteraceae bacterium]
MPILAVTNILPGPTGIGGDIVAVVLAVLLFALLYWSISWISKI